MTGPSSERTADALRGMLVQAVSHNPIDPDSSWAVLHEWDRLVARNQQLQEALEPFTHYDFAAAQWLDGLHDEGHELRALWAEDIEALRDYAATARAALASVRANQETSR